MRVCADWMDVPESTPFERRAIELAREQEDRWPERDGEAKRHQVYARLIKEFPEMRRRVLARVIEDAVADL